jgi:hypothetical protein
MYFEVGFLTMLYQDYIASMTGAVGGMRLGRGN